MMIKVKGTELNRGDVIDVWWAGGKDTIIDIVPSSGVFDFVCFVAVFAKVGMSIVADETYTVFNR
jgi:hypothetical protein